MILPTVLVAWDESGEEPGLEPEFHPPFPREFLQNRKLDPMTIKSQVPPATHQQIFCTNVFSELEEEERRRGKEGS